MEKYIDVIVGIVCVCVCVIIYICVCNCYNACVFPFLLRVLYDFLFLFVFFFVMGILVCSFGLYNIVLFFVLYIASNLIKINENFTKQLNFTCEQIDKNNITLFYMGFLFSFVPLFFCTKFLHCAKAT